MAPAGSRVAEVAEPAGSGPSTRPTIAPATGPANSPTSDDSARVHGIVLDPAGKPVANARVVVAANQPDPNQPPPEPLAEIRTGADGRFDLSFRKPAPQSAAVNFAGVLTPPAVVVNPAAGAAPAAALPVPAVVASADGYGRAGGRSDRGGDTGGGTAATLPLEPGGPGEIRWGDVALRLVPDRPIEGRIFDSRAARSPVCG